MIVSIVTPHVPLVKRRIAEGVKLRRIAEELGIKYNTFYSYVTENKIAPKGPGSTSVIEPHLAVIRERLAHDVPLRAIADEIGVSVKTLSSYTLRKSFREPRKRRSEGTAVHEVAIRAMVKEGVPLKVIAFRLRVPYNTLAKWTSNNKIDVLSYKPRQLTLKVPYGVYGRLKSMAGNRPIEYFVADILARSVADLK